MRQLRILYVGPDYRGSNGTCFRDAFLQLGHEVRTIDDEQYAAMRGLSGRLYMRMRRRPRQNQIDVLNQRIVREANEFRPDLTFYVKAYFVLPETVEQTRKYGPNFVYMNDDMFVHSSVRTFTFFDNVKRMDCVLTTKSFSVREYHAAGASLVVYIPNAYDPKIHFPARPTDAERYVYEGDVSFIGFFRAKRADLLSELARFRNEFRLNIWGGGWGNITRFDNWHRYWKWRRLRGSIRGGALWCEEMGKAIQSNRISLGLLCREVRDLHTSRSFEIPACGGFMLAERTEEHRMYFEEDKEAVYFSSFQELTDKIRFYLAHDGLRGRIAEAGYERCMRSRATYADRALFALEQFARLRPNSLAIATT